MDLMLKGISELSSVRKCVARAQLVTKFIYNHHNPLVDAEVYK